MQRETSSRYRCRCRFQGLKRQKLVKCGRSRPEVVTAAADEDGVWLWTRETGSLILLHYHFNIKAVLYKNIDSVCEVRCKSIDGAVLAEVTE